MSFLFKKKIKKIYHIDHLPLLNRKVIKTLFDSNLPDLMKLYGLKFSVPLYGEPILIPYGAIAEEYKDSKELLNEILLLKDGIKQEGLKKYSEWYPESQFLDYYRIVQYSYADPQEGMIIGLGFHPLEISPEGYFKLKGLSEFIENKKVFIANQALFAQTLNRFSIFTRAKEIVVNDIVFDKINEIVEFHLWLLEYFHLNYDKDKLFDKDIAYEYMKIGLEKINQITKNTIKNKIMSNYDTVILPIFVLARNFHNTNITELKRAWQEDPNLNFILKQARFHEIDSIPVLMSYNVIERLVEDIKALYDEVIVVFDKNIPPISKCKSECPKFVLENKVIKEGENYKVIQFKR
ncbi:MAG: hypothetical protein QXV69_06695 [Sulfolobaceae archaeon]